MKTLKGMTWNHSRGYVPMAATAQRFAELNPGVEIVWEKRSLQEFADYPLEKLIDKYDLLVIDHPWAGYAAANDVLLPLERYLAPKFLANQAANSVGGSHASYTFGGSQYALAIDAATPVASYRADLFAKAGEALPETWEDVLRLAEKGFVVMPGIPIDTLMNFYMFCGALGEDPFVEGERVVSERIGTEALELLKQITSLCPNEIAAWNPIRVYEALAETDRYLYCPFAYGYSNYARPGYASSVLTFADTVAYGGSGRLRTTLGGTGLAISHNCAEKELAVEYAAFVAGERCQQTLYVETGGQPGHRAAWTSEAVNERCGSYFANTLPCLDRAYIRPRYDGYLHFQDHGGSIVLDYIRGESGAKAVLERLDELYRESRKGANA